MSNWERVHRKRTIESQREEMHIKSIKPEGEDEPSVCRIQSEPVEVFFFLFCFFLFYCQLSQLVTARGFLLVRGATLNVHRCLVASSHAMQCWTKLLPKPV